MNLKVTLEIAGPEEQLSAVLEAYLPKDSVLAEHIMSSLPDKSPDYSDLRIVSCSIEQETYFDE